MNKQQRLQRNKRAYIITLSRLGYAVKDIMYIVGASYGLVSKCKDKELEDYLPVIRFGDYTMTIPDKSMKEVVLTSADHTYTICPEQIKGTLGYPEIQRELDEYFK